MPKVVLRAHQEEALLHMKNGCILNGGVGSGKSLTSLAYYFENQGGLLTSDCLIPMKNPCDLYIITTARKRDTFEWEVELNNFDMSSDISKNKYKNNIIVDSWNNIHKYVDIKDAFFIFDEQRVVGYGKWTQSFLKITKSNQWILLTATPGDTWMDYVPVFIANGFFKNKSDFLRRHVVFSPYTVYPKVDRYVNEGRLLRYKKDILVPMDFKRNTVAEHIYLNCDYDINAYKYMKQNRWNIYENKPMKNASEYCSCLRRCVNSSEDRKRKLLSILEDHPKAIIFYSFDYELEILRELLTESKIIFSEWNGHRHQPLPDGNKWAYLVEYAAGNEGWNCIQTDTIIFYSLQYSYKVMVQASGRTDRLNTPFRTLYYYHLRSTSDIDRAIDGKLKRKKKFNERDFAPIFDE